MKAVVYFRFVEKLLFMLPVYHGVFRSMCLEVLLSQADIRPTLYRELKEKGFHDMLKFRSVKERGKLVVTTSLSLMCAYACCIIPGMSQHSLLH